jgi:hypothetical protein
MQNLSLANDNPFLNASFPHEAPTALVSECVVAYSSLCLIFAIPLM